MNEDRMAFLSEWLSLADAHLKRPCDKLAFYDAVLRYGIFGQLPKVKGMVGVCFEFAKVRIDEMQNRKNRYRSSVEKRQLSNNCPTIAEKETENKKENSPLHLPVRKEQENKKPSNANAQTDTREDFSDLIPAHLAADPDFLREWGEWLDFRKKARKKVSRMAAARQLKLLGDYQPDDAIRIIETSITNDWQGLFPCKVKNIKLIRDYTGI